MLISSKKASSATLVREWGKGLGRMEQGLACREQGWGVGNRV